MYIATPEQPASYLFITRTSHLYHTRPQNAPHATHKFRVLLLNARTQPSFDQTDDGVDAETSLSFSLSAFLSLFSAFTLFSRAHIRSVYSLWKWKTKRRRSGQSITASDFGSNGPRFESGRGRCIESLDKALYSHCPKEKPSHQLLLAIWPSL